MLNNTEQRSWSMSSYLLWNSC